MTDIQHTQECIKVRQEQDNWISKWPNYCQKCGGYGAIYDTGNRFEPPSTDICPKCLSNGLCPRCGEQSVDFVDYDHCDYGICNNCGWDEWVLIHGWPDTEDMTFPEHECWCWDTEEARLEAERLANE